MAQTANQYSTETESTTSTGSLLSVNFGFDASYVRIANRGAAPLRFTLTSTAATTNDGALRAGEAVEWRGGGATYRAGVMSTSTSTDGVDTRRVHLYATGG